MVQITSMFSGVRYTNVNQMLDNLGLPQSLTATIGQRVSVQGAGWQAAATSLAGMVSGQDTSTFFGKSLPPSGFIPRPLGMLQRNRGLFGQSFHSAHRAFTPGPQLSGTQAQNAMQVANSVHQIAYTDVRARMYMEERLGGQIVADGRMDMRISVQRYEPYVYQVPYNESIAKSPQANGMFGALAQLEKNIMGVAGQLVRGGANSSSWGLQDPTMQNIAKQMNMAEPLAFEDLLFLNMMTYSKNKETDIMGSMNELVRNSEGNATGIPGVTQNSYTGGPTAYGGLAGGPTGSAYSNIAGGAAASPEAMAQALYGSGGAQYMGFPAAGTAKSGGTATGATGAAGAAGSGSYNPLDANQSDATRQAMLQKMMQDLQRMYTMVSNVMKSMHDMQMAAVRNIR